MSIRRKWYAFAGISRTIQLLGGIPVDVDFWEPANSSDSISLAKPLVMIGALVGVFVNNFIQIRKHFGRVFDFENLSEAMEVSVADVVTLHLLFSFGLVSTAGFVLLFACKRKKIAVLYRQLARMGGRVHWPAAAEETSRDKWNWWSLAIPASCVNGIVAGTCYSWVVTDALRSVSSDGQLDAIDWVTIISQGMGVALSIGNNTVVIGVAVLCVDVLHFLVDILVTWRSKMTASRPSSGGEGSSEKGREMSHTARENLTLVSSFCGLMDLANAVLAPFLTLTYSYVLIGGVLFTYGSFGILLDAPLGKHQLLLLAENLLIAVIFYAIPLRLSILGNQLRGKAAAAAAALRELVSETYRELDDRTRFDAKAMLEELRASARIAPYDLFEVSNANFVGVLATHATYIIVALQFRSS